MRRVTLHSLSGPQLRVLRESVKHHITTRRSRRTVQVLVRLGLVQSATYLRSLSEAVSAGVVVRATASGTALLSGEVAS